MDEIVRMQQIQNEINARTLNTLPHIFATYMTLVETEFAEKVKIHFDRISKQVSVTRGGMILDGLSDETPD